jgi:hypothetical protein
VKRVAKANRSVQALVTKSELREVKRRAAAAGLSVSAFVRRVLVEHVVNRGNTERALSTIKEDLRGLVIDMQQPPSGPVVTTDRTRRCGETRLRPDGKEGVGPWWGPCDLPRGHSGPHECTLTTRPLR